MSINSEKIIDDRGDLDLTKQIDELHERIAELLQINEEHQKINGKLQSRIYELEEDCKMLEDRLEFEKVDKLRAQGL